MRVLLRIFVFVSVATASGAASGQSLTAEEAHLLNAVNAVRAEAGLGPYVPDMNLTNIARSHSQDMSNARFFSHTSPTTGTMGDRLRASGVPFRRAGENIAFDPTIEGAHQAFLASPSHRENVLDPNYTHVGIGIIATSRGYYVTQNFIQPRPNFAAALPVQAAPPPSPGPGSPAQPAHVAEAPRPSVPEAPARDAEAPLPSAAPQPVPVQAPVLIAQAPQPAPMAQAPQPAPMPVAQVPAPVVPMPVYAPAPVIPTPLAPELAPVPAPPQFLAVPTFGDPPKPPAPTMPTQFSGYGAPVQPW